MIKKLFCTFVIASCFSVQFYANSPHLSIIGSVNTNDGIGKIAPELAIALAQDINLELYPTRMSRKDELPIPVLNMISKNKKPSGKVVFFCDNLTPQSSVIKKFYRNTRQNHILVAYSMLESTAIPKEWAKILNTNFDAVAVPDIFLVDVYKNSGVNIPIFVLPLGMNLTQLLNLPLKTERHTPLVFGSLGSAIDRKNIPLLIRAFTKAFGKDNNNVFLTINSRYGDKITISQIEKEIETLGATNISFNNSSASIEDYIKLHQSFDVYISLSKGEGFSFQPRESMALGTPVIVTDNTAQSTICKSNLVRVVPAKVEEAAIYSHSGGDVHGTNFNCTIDDAVDALLDVFHNYETYLNKSTEMRDWAKQYDYCNQKTVFNNFFQPKEIVLGKENKITSEYLMTNSLEFYTKLKKIHESEAKK